MELFYVRAVQLKDEITADSKTNQQGGVRRDQGLRGENGSAEKIAVDVEGIGSS